MADGAPPDSATTSDAGEARDAGSHETAASGDSSSTDDTTGPDPAKACEPVAEIQGVCEWKVGDGPAITGGNPPDGIYDRIAIGTPLAQVDPVCIPSELLLDRGVFQLTFHDIGGPYVAGGKVNVDQAAKRLVFTVACGNSGADSVRYSYDDSKKTLTVFNGENVPTPWIYKRR